MMNDLKRSRAQHASPLNIARLEQRILMSASPIGDLALDPHATAQHQHVPHAPLSDSTPPTALGLGDFVDGEDANNAVIHLDDYFTDNRDPSLTYAIVHDTNPSLHDSASIVTDASGSRLILDHAADAFGEATLTIRATDDAGNFVEDQLRVVLLPVNDRPTTTGLQNIVVNEDSAASVIHLFNAFDDLEDADSELVFSITQNTNPQLFSSIVIDAVNGTMTFHYAPNAHGSSQITIRATDTEGMYVEMSTAGADFPVYDWLFGQPDVHYPDVQLDGMDIIANHWLFPYVNGHYQFDQFDEVRLRTYLRTLPEGANFVFNIENDYYDNTPEGRDRFAEVFSVVHDERPDIVNFGVYRIMPENSFFIPTRWYRAQEDTERGLSSYYSRNYSLFQGDHHAWEARNDLFRTQPVSPQFGGQPLAEMVGLIIPSLYTQYRDDAWVMNALTVELDIDTAHSTFSLRDEVVYEGMYLGFAPGIGASTPQGLVPLQGYYVVNATETSFQLALDKGGTPITLQGTAQGNFFAAIIDQRFLEHDPAVRYWEAFARGNIIEARQYNHTVLPWLSPSIAGLGLEYIDENFFRMQLDLMFELGDGIGLYDEGTSAGARLENRGWWAALEGFMDYIHSPTQFTITVNPVNDPPHWVGVAEILAEPGVAHSVVDLWQHFHDVDNTASQLSLSIVGSTTPQAFESLAIVDHTLHIHHTVGRLGISFITVRASDPSGLTAEDMVFVQVGHMPAPASMDAWAGDVTRLHAPAYDAERLAADYAIDSGAPHHAATSSLGREFATVEVMSTHNASLAASHSHGADSNVESSTGSRSAEAPIIPLHPAHFAFPISDWREHARRGWVADWQTRQGLTTYALSHPSVTVRNISDHESESKTVGDLLVGELTPDAPAMVLLPLRSNVHLIEMGDPRRSSDAKVGQKHVLARQD